MDCTTHEYTKYTHVNFRYFGLYKDITIVNKMNHPCRWSLCSERVYNEPCFVGKSLTEINQLTADGETTRTWSVYKYVKFYFINK